MKKITIAILLFPCIVFSQTKKITLEDIYKFETFSSESVPGFRSMSNGSFFTESTKGGLLKKNFVTGDSVETIISSADAKDDFGKSLSLKDIEWSKNEQKILIFTEREKIYRRSSKAIVYAYDLLSKKTIKIDTAKILHATYSPDGNYVAYVKNNNLFFKNLINNTITQITNDGEWNAIINGNSDWVYEEELKLSKAFQWSKTGQYLAYYKFNESKVPEYKIPLYKDFSMTSYSYKYPIAGEVISTVEIHIYNMATGKDVKADIGSESDVYVPRIKWTEDGNTLAIAWMNRLQNHLKWLVANATTGSTYILYDETNKYYTEINDNINFLKDGKHFIITSEKDGFQNIYLGDINSRQISQLTSNRFDIENILGIDEKLKLVYFSAGYPTPMERQLFSVQYGSKKKLQNQITKESGTHKITFNEDFTYYVDNFSTINRPPVISIFDSKGKLIRNLKDNAKLNQKLLDYSIGKVEFLKIPNTKRDTLNGWMLKPADFDSSKKYPILFCNYGGPGSQRVLDSWGSANMWQQYLSQNGYIIVCIDNTGTGFRGEEFKKKTYLQLGKLEIEDQIDAAKYLGTLSYIDKSRIGHWGWSYGGFMSCLAITKGADIFKMAVAVAPVTNWRFYDNIYTERYMRMPKENTKGYDENAPMYFTKNIKGKFLIIHGTADDNVHFQNSVMMIENMIQNNIDFESGYYPNKNHSISGGNTTYHIYKKMTNFIFLNL